MSTGDSSTHEGPIKKEIPREAARLMVKAVSFCSRSMRPVAPNFFAFGVVSPLWVKFAEPFEVKFCEGEGEMQFQTKSNLFCYKQ